MSLLKISAVSTLLLLVSFLLLSLFLDDQRKIAANSNSAYEGCEKRGGDFLVNFPRDCLDKYSPGSFKISDTIFSSCKIKQSGLASSIYEKVEVILSIPISDFLVRSFKNGEGKVVEDKVVIELESPFSRSDIYRCGNQKVATLVEASMLAAREENKELQLLEAGNYKIEGLSRASRVFAFEENGQFVARRFSDRRVSAEGSYNVYFKKHPSSPVQYIVSCLSWNNECHGNAVGFISGDYNYRVHFSKKYEDSAFEVMDKTYSVLSAAYSKN